MKKLSTFESFINERVLNEASIGELDKLLAAHDWYYMMSDDSREYSKGSDEEKAILKLVDQLGDAGREHYKAAFKKRFPNANEDFSINDKEQLNEAGESLTSLLADASPKVKALAAEIEKMLEPQRFKIGIGYYDKVMQNIAAIAKSVANESVV